MGKHRVVDIDHQTNTVAARNNFASVHLLVSPYGGTSNLCRVGIVHSNDKCRPILWGNNLWVAKGNDHTHIRGACIRCELEHTGIVALRCLCVHKHTLV